ncbi:MAG: PVC-type heme-binding CxxCH protein, partial [Verrucomicrobiota bacterium]
MKPDSIFLRIFSATLVICSTFHCVAAENPFAEIIRKTEPLKTEQEQKSFHLPPGFEIQLVAAEPDIAKPMNMAFDAKGRLWITQSREYPFPAQQGKGRDAIKILENFDANGRAQKITTFADGLNIPIGLYPYKNGVVAYSIPNISYYEDTDGDSRADKTNFLYGPFGFDKDTHGMTSAFRRGYDGWLYACHGFNNTTTIKGTDGQSITMNSGNTYRMRLDGSHVEQFTWGQVNPFGLAFDPLGNLYSADCHSSPIYQLIRGAHYPSFGKPDDGLGFAPTMMDHSHGSTAIGGIVFYADEKFPKEFRKNFFIGNVMTCRINRDSIIENGATWRAKEEPDFLSSDDPWFRPVDIQLAPDGSIYVADFYNRIIGHYEVPLDNPGRDRERGRIWRIVYTGKMSREERKGSEEKKSSSQPSRTSRDTKFLISELASANITRRMLAMNELTDRIGKPAISPLQKILRSSTNSFQKAHALWALQRLGGLDEKILARAVKDDSLEVRVHFMRILGESSEWNSTRQQILQTGLRDNEPLVSRASAEALGLHPDFENIRPLLDARRKIQKEDTHFLHTLRIALRNQLLPKANFKKIAGSELSEADSRAIADVSVGVTNAAAADFYLRHVQKFSETREKLASYLRYIARYGESGMEELAKFTETKLADDLDFQLALFKSIQEGSAQRGNKLAQPIRDWGTRLAKQLLVSIDEKSLDWRNSPIKGDTTNPWIFQIRESSDGDKTSQFFCSFPPGGEKLTGILRSRPFTIPASLGFFIAGHDGSPEKPPMKKNLIRLRDVETQKIIASTPPPRNDIAQPFTWNLADYVGKKGALEIVDGNGGHSFAWLAVGRFNPQVVPFPTVIPSQVDQRQQSAAELAASLDLKELEPQLAQILRDNEANVDVRAAAAKALGKMSAGAHLSEFEKFLNNSGTPEKLREKVAEALADVNSTEARNILLNELPNAPRKLQLQIALALASNADGAESLLASAEKGKVSARLLQENSVRERLGAAKNPETKMRLEKLIAGLAPLSAEKQKLIDDRRVKFTEAETDAESGAKIFTQNCAVCHQLEKQGALVGPQLDGVGNRGADRLME